MNDAGLSGHRGAGPAENALSLAAERIGLGDFEGALHQLSGLESNPEALSLAALCSHRLGRTAEARRSQLKALSILLAQNGTAIQLSEHYARLALLEETPAPEGSVGVTASFGLLSHPAEPVLRAATGRRIPTAPRTAAGNGISPPSVKSSSPISVLFAPIVTAGNATNLAGRLKHMGVDARTVDYFPNYLGYKADYTYRGSSQEGLSAFSDQCLELAEKSDMIVVEFACSFKSLPSMNVNLDPDRPLYSDLAHLKSRGKRIVAAFWGSDVFSQAHLHYHYLCKLGLEIPEPPTQTRSQYHIVQQLNDVVDCMLAPSHYQRSLPRLVPFWDTCLDIEAWPFQDRSLDRVTRVISAPTSKRKKNYDIIESALGRIKLKHPHVVHRTLNGVPNHEAKKIYMQADLAVDQATSHFGLFAVEQMALGVPIAVSRADWPGASHRNQAPIINFASVADLYDRLDQVLCDSGNLRDQCRAGREYVEKYHSVQIMAEALLAYFTELRETGRVKELDCPAFQAQSRIWQMNPEQVPSFKYYDVSVPAFCALGNYEQALCDCRESMQNGYRPAKFMAWLAAISLKMDAGSEDAHRLMQHLQAKGGRQLTDLAGHYRAVLIDPQKLIAEVEAAQAEARRLASMS